MALIIPGVEVKVVKEVLAPQLAPSGVLGLVGFTGGAAGTLRAASWNHCTARSWSVVGLRSGFADLPATVTPLAGSWGTAGSAVASAGVSLGAASPSPIAGAEVAAGS